MATSTLQYTKVAVILHWLIAVVIVAMLMSGIVMKNPDIFSLEKSLQFRMYQWHKSLGVIALLLIVARVLWRVTHRPPPLPDSIPHKEQKMAHVGHNMLYIWMIVMPLSGWIMVSASAYGLPTIIFGGPEWPHISGLEGNADVENLAKQVHYYMGYSFALLILGHIAAVVLHKVKHQQSLLVRMSLRKDKALKNKDETESEV